MPDHTHAIDPADAHPSSSSEAEVSEPPTTRRGIAARVRGAITAINLRLFTASAAIYVLAGSFVGFEGLAFLLGFAPLWPIAIPIVIAGVAGAGFVVRQVRRGRIEDD